MDDTTDSGGNAQTPDSPDLPDSLTPRRSGPPLMALIGGGIAVVAVIGVVVLALGPLGGLIGALLGQPQNAAFKFMAKDTAAYVHVALTGPQLKNAETIKTRFLAVPELKEAWSRLEKQALATKDSGITWDTDVAPWLGAEAAIVFPAGADQGRGLQQVLLLAATRDQGKSDAYVKKWRAAQEKDGSTFSEKQSRGVTYLTDGKKNHLATVDGFLVFAPKEQVLIDAIAVVKDDKAARITDNAVHKDILQALPASRLGEVFVNVEVVSKLPMVAAKPGATPDVQFLRGYGAALTFEAQSVELHMATLYDSSRIPAAYKPLVSQKASPLKVASALPAETITVLTFNDLKTTVNTVLTEYAKANPSINGELDNVKKQTGIDVKADLLEWMDGEVALAVIEDPDAVSGPLQTPIGLVLLVEAKQKAAATAGMGKVRDLLMKIGLTRSTKALGGTEFDLFEAPLGRNQPTMSFGYGVVGDFVVVGSSPTALGKVAGAKASPLAGSKDFQAAQGRLAKENVALFFLDTQRVRAMVAKVSSRGPQVKAVGEALEATKRFSAFLAPIRSLVVGYEPADDKGVQRGRVVLSLVE